MPPVSDLVQDSKLETTFYERCTQHVYHVPGANPRQRKMRREERWERCRNLGAGTFGTVWLEKLIVDGGEGRYRAVKEIKKEMQLPGAIDYNRELEAIAKFSHQKYNICFVKSLGWYESPECIFIAMEYFPLGDLQNYLSSPLPEKDTQQIIFQVLEGLSFMHDNGFAHRDLKPKNILIQSKDPVWWVKIGDFGISKRVGEGLPALQTFTGTPGFLAPEILAQHGLFGDYDFGVGKEYTVAVDIWSLGEIAFRALTREQPFPVRFLEAYVRGASPFPVGVLQAHGVSEEGCGFLTGLMAPMPEDRLTARDALSHIWIESQEQSPPTASAEAHRYPFSTFWNLADEANTVSRSSSTKEETAPSLEPPTTEASASWSSVDTAPKPSILEDLAFTEVPPAMAQPRRSTRRTTANSVNYRMAGLWPPDNISRGISTVAFSPDGKLVAASLNKAVRLWDITTKVVRCTFDDHWDEVYVVVFSPDGKLVASASWDKTIKIWDAATGVVCYTVDVRSDRVCAVAFRRVVGNHKRVELDISSTITVGGSAAGSDHYLLSGLSAMGYATYFYAIPFSLDGERTSIYDHRGETVKMGLLDSAVGVMHRTFKDRVYPITFCPNGLTVASASRGGKVKFWIPSPRGETSTLKFDPDRVYAMAFSPDGHLVATASRNKTVRLWSYTTAALRRTLKGHSDRVSAITFSPNSKLVASASWDKTVRLWDSATGALRYTLKGHLDRVYAVVFSPDGKLVASASRDSTIRFWDSATGAATTF
ncbi:MAG: hypothetical protein M1840_000755 [Geoglossum simile]|nr:MAG: hypothetical protein M1840_000755 [Geoglossum simile]